MNEKSFLCLVQVLDKCKRWGYTNVWFNHRNPHWTHSDCNGMIVAEPRLRNGSGIPLWGLGYDPLERDVIGSMGCGNGLKDADQGQWYHVGKNFPSAHYALVNGLWEEM